MRRVADMRTDVSTMAQAEAVMEDIARNTIELTVADARFERRIAKAKTEHAASTADLRTEIQRDESRLLRFIIANPGHFEKPRKHKTNFGAFGMQSVTELQIDVLSALKTHLITERLSSLMEEK